MRQCSMRRCYPSFGRFSSGRLNGSSLLRFTEHASRQRMYSTTRTTRTPPVAPALLVAGTAFMAPMALHHLTTSDFDAPPELIVASPNEDASPNEEGFISIFPSTYEKDSSGGDSSVDKQQHPPKPEEVAEHEEENEPSASAADGDGAAPTGASPSDDVVRGDGAAADASSPAASPAPGHQSEEGSSTTSPTEPPLPPSSSSSSSKTSTAPSPSSSQSSVDDGAAEDTPSNGSNGSSAPGYSVEKYKYVIIGSGTAAYNALAVIAHKDPDATVLMVGEERERSYMRPPLSKELWGEEEDPSTKDYNFTNWMGREESLYYKKLSMKNLKVVKGTKAQSIKAKHKAVLLEDDTIVFYDKCLVAIGGKPKPAPFAIEGDAQDRVTTFRNLGDFQSLYQITSKPIHVTVVGGGFLGSELSAGLASRAKTTGTSITQVFPEAGCMGHALPEYLSDDATRNMTEEGVQVMTHKTVSKIDAQGDRLVVTLQDDTTFETDHVVVCTGIDTDKKFASESGLEVDQVNGGIVVNSELQALSDVYVAGDASSFYDVGLKVRRRVEHYNHAVSSGRVAGGNMTGERNVFSHQSSFWSDLPGISYEAVGLIDSQLRTVGIFAKPSPDASADDKKYGKGIVYYLKDHRVVGVLTWNLGGKMSQARKIIAKGKRVHNSKDLADWIGLEES